MGGRERERAEERLHQRHNPRDLIYFSRKDGPIIIEFCLSRPTNVARSVAPARTGARHYRTDKVDLTVGELSNRSWSKFTSWKNLSSLRRTGLSANQWYSNDQGFQSRPSASTLARCSSLISLSWSLSVLILSDDERRGEEWSVRGGNDARKEGRSTVNEKGIWCKEGGRDG